MRKRNKGFTLAETLIAVAIIIILLALAAIAVPRYQRKMKQTEYDGIAKEIFVAAQNNLSKTVGQGYLGAEDSAFGEKESDDIYLLAYPANKENSILPQLLPFGSIDDTVRQGGSYIIRYQRSTGLVLDVFYSNPGDKLGCTLSAADCETLLGLNKAGRASYGSGKKVVGYYGGAAAATRTNSDFAAPVLSINNGDTLYVTVRSGNGNPAPSDELLKLTITGEESGAVRTIKFSEHPEYDTFDASVGYKIVLDDITSDMARFKLAFSEFIPGENLILQAEAYVEEGDTVTKSALTPKRTTNSLFADLESGEVKISNIRHLENLDVNSGFAGEVNGTAVQSAVQTTDLSLKDFLDGEFAFVPVSPKTTLSYDGCYDDVIHTVSDIKTAYAGDAGLFGSLGGGTVKNLILKDFDIESTNGSAGAVCGSAKNVQFSNILVYNTTSATVSDAALSVAATENAGGLVGSMTGGSISDCAAAVYVKAGEYAGGLVGSAINAGAITSSYSGGHTQNARYQSWLNDAARINVQGDSGAGGLVGFLSGNTTVSYSYATSSVATKSGGFAGGFVGKAAGAAFTNCYTTAMVSYTTGAKCETYIGSASGCSFNGINYYLENLSGNKIGKSVSAVTGQSGTNKNLPKFIFIEGNAGNRQPAYIYDDSLKVDYGGGYYYPTVAQLHEFYEDGSTYVPTDVTKMHYGDWQVPFLENLGYTIDNGDKLSISIEKETLKDSTSFVFAITGETSTTDSVNNTIFYRVDLGSGVPTVTKRGVAGADQNIQWSDVAAEHRPPVKSTTAEGKTSIIITLDDVTVPGGRFQDIFGDTALIPGENITVRLVVATNPGVNDIMDAPCNEAENSLFAHGSGSGTAKISTVRHLENLNTAVSGIGKSDKVTFTKAVLNADIDWDDCKENYAQIYNSKTAPIECDRGKLPGLENLTVTDFDGQNNSLINFDFAPALFKDLKSTNVHNLEFVDCSATEGILAGKVSGTGISVNTVLARDSSSTTVPSVSGSGAAGGLIGTVAGGASLNLNNSSASVLISSSGSAGGLIGKNEGTLTVQSCYVGGRTESGKYSDTNYNIVSSDRAGGLIGENIGSANISYSFGTASVSGINAAGGLVGSNTGALTFDTVYTIAPVKGIGSSNLFGAGVGTTSTPITNSAAYYLPELYTEAVDFIGYGLISKAAGNAYYQRSDENNKISAKAYVDTMQTKTKPYDLSLNSNKYDDVCEYPFSTWTTFPVDGVVSKVYYGDWEPIVSPETVPYTISFFYKNPTTGSDKLIAVNDGTLGEQEIHEGETNRVLLPYIEPFVGYDITGWKINYTDASGAQQTVTFTTDSGSLTLDAAYCYGNITAEALYTAAPRTENYCTLAFFYAPGDPTGEDYATEGRSIFEQIGQTATYLKDTDLSKVESPIRVIEGYNFVGWYDSPDFTGTRYDLDNDGSDTKLLLDRDLELFAKYDRIEYYNITIDFMYSLADDPANYQHLQSVPRYRLDDQPQYRIQCVKGLSFIEDVTLPNVGENFNNPSLTDYNDHDADFLKACHLYVNEDGKSIHIESIVNDSEEEESKDINIIVVYRVVDATGLVMTPYHIQYVLADTAADGSYSEGSEFVYNPYEGKDNTPYFMAPVGTEINVRPMTEGAVPGTSLDLFGYDVQNIDKLTITENPDNNVVQVSYSRRQFVLTFNSLGGTYVYPQTVRYGVPLETVHPDAASMKRQGYGFDTTKGDNGWTILDLGVNFQDNTNIETKYHWNQAMPAANIVAWANWESKPVEYRVMFWYENSDSDSPYDPDNYSYMGSLNREVLSGTEIKSSDYKDYPGMSATAHTTHTKACYPGVGDPFGTITETTHTYSFTYQYRKNSSDKNLSTQTVYPTLSDDGKTFTVDGKTYDCIKSGNTLQIRDYKYETYQTRYASKKTTITQTIDVTDKTTNTNLPAYGGKEITIANSTNKTNGYVSTWSCKDGSASGKCIYFDGTWYLYYGSTEAGKIPPCEMGTYEWIDKTNFTFNDNFTETKTVSSDGTTVLNVYFTRNYYTLTFQYTGKCLLEEHTHTDECYAYYCPGAHFHTEECLTCDKEEHTHTVECCSLTEHTHSAACCSLTEHTHSAACCSLTAHTHDKNCCSLTEHTHSAACCSLTEHTHDASCGVKTTKSTGNQSIWEGLSQYKASNYQNQVKKINGTYYRSEKSGNKWYWCTVTEWNCGLQEHTHGTGCNHEICAVGYEHKHGTGCNHEICPVGYEHKHGTGCNHEACAVGYEHKHGTGCNSNACAVGYEHTHGSGCNSNACPVGYEHTHTKAQGCYNGCDYPDHVHDENCIRYLVCTKPEHTHSTNCSSSSKTNTLYIIKAKYNEDIHEHFPITAGTTSFASYTWTDNGSPRYYQYALKTLDRMPAANVTFDGSNRGTVKTILYYKEVVAGDTEGAEKITVNGTTKYFKQYKTVMHDFSYLTTDEEYHLIEGFTRFAYDEGGGPKSGTKSQYTWNTQKITKFYYSRDVSSLEFYVGGEKKNAMDVQYGASLGSVSYTPTGAPSADYTFDGWYADPGLKTKIDFSKTTMPLGNLAVYGRWAPPSYSVKFDVDYAAEEGSEAAVYKASVMKKTEGTTVKYDPADTTFRSFLVERDANISDFITDAKGFVLDAYTPEKEGYTFEGWCYDLVNTPDIEKQPFISSIAITGPIVIYADWKAIADAGDMRDVTIYYYHALQNKPIQNADVIRDTYHIGERPAFTAPDIYGYYPITMVQYLTVTGTTEGSANSITFFYMPITEWNYRTEYYVSYRNYETDTDGVFADGTFSSGTHSYLVCSTDGIPAYDQYVNVEFEFPEGYEDGYRLVQYDANGSIVKTTNTVARLKKQNATGTETEEELKMLNVVKFYIEPDPGKFLITDRITTYNGESQTLAREDVTASNCFAFPNRAYDKTYEVDLPNFALDDPDAPKTKTLTTHYYNSVSAGYSVGGDAKAFVANEYRYFTGDRIPIEDSSLPESQRNMIDAGAYRMNGYVVLSVKGADGVTHTFLEWKNVNYDLNLRIQPRPVTIESTSASQSYSATSPLVRSDIPGDIQVTGPNDGKSAFVKNDGAVYFFSADAFRLEVGTTDNAFTYELTPGTNQWNYQITVKFGKLTVTK